MKRKEILDKIKALGWEYEEKYWGDGSVMTYIFRLHDATEAENYWEVSIEDYHGEGDVNDWIIYTLFHDPKNKDWYGRQIDTHCAVEYNTMKLIMDFISVIDEEKYGAKKATANNPINSYTHGFADGYSKGFIDAIEFLTKNEDIRKEIKNV